MTFTARSLGLLSLLVATSCGEGEGFRVNYAPEYARGGAVSVLGVFKDGRLDADAWEQLGPKLFPKGQCGAGYNPEFVHQNGNLASAMDDYVRENGVTDGFLGQWAPFAQGDTILVVAVAGHPAQKKKPSAAAPAPAAPMGRRSRGMGGGRSIGASRSEVETDVFQVTASVYSVRVHRTVAQLDMKYTGNDADEAMAEFGRRMAADLPVSSCVGFRAELPSIDAAKIRDLKEE